MRSSAWSVLRSHGEAEAEFAAGIRAAHPEVTPVLFGHSGRPRPDFCLGATCSTCRRFTKKLPANHMRAANVRG